MDQMELQNHDSTKCSERTCWEMMSDKWNDKNYNPKTMIFLTEGQDMFREEIELPYSSVAHLAAATPDKCKTKMSEMMGQLKRVVQDWERSGQGDGGNDGSKENSVRFELGVLSEGHTYNIVIFSPVAASICCHLYLQSAMVWEWTLGGCFIGWAVISDNVVRGGGNFREFPL